MSNVDLFPKGCLQPDSGDHQVVTFWLVSLKTLWGEHLQITPQAPLWVESLYKFWCIHKGSYTDNEEDLAEKALTSLIEATLKAGPYWDLET